MPTIYESSLKATPERLITDRRPEWYTKAAQLIPRGDELYAIHQSDLARRRARGEAIQLSLWIEHKPKAGKVIQLRGKRHG